MKNNLSFFSNLVIIFIVGALIMYGSYWIPIKLFNSIYFTFQNEYPPDGFLHELVAWILGTGTIILVLIFLKAIWSPLEFYVRGWFKKRN